MAVLLASPCGFAECTLGMTAEECLSAVEESLRDDGIDILADEPDEIIDKARQTTASTAEDILRIFNTGISSALSDGGVSTLEDFLPKFKIFGSSGGLDEDDERVVIEFNDILNLPTDSGYKITTTLRRATVFEPLIQTVDADIRSNERDALEGQLNDFDDATFTFTYSPMTDKWGRSDHQLHADVFEALFLSAERHAGEIRSAAESVREVADDALEDAIEAADTALLTRWRNQGAGFCGAELATVDIPSSPLDIDPDSLTGNQLICVGLAADPPASGTVAAAATSEATYDISPGITATIRSYYSAIEGAYREEYTNLAALNKSLDSMGFFRFADLINNQPQLNFSASYSNRDALVGQDEYEVKFSYEKGFVNVNSFRRYVENGCQHDQTYLCLQDYMTPANERHLKRGDRFSFNLSYSHKQSYDRALESGAGRLALDSENSLIASLGYGRYLSFLADGEGNSRLEISASYEDVDGDSMRQDRLFSTATYSQRIGDTAAVSFSVVYANKPEFRGDVGTEISAQLGISYKLFSPKEF